MILINLFTCKFLYINYYLLICDMPNKLQRIKVAKIDYYVTVYLYYIYIFIYKFYKIYIK